MRRNIPARLLATALMLWTPVLWADSYSDAVGLFKNAGESARFFDKSYGYAVFPTIGKAGLVVGGAHGSGRVYVHGRYVGNATVNQLSAGFQAGGQAYSQIVFFEDRRAFDPALGDEAGEDRRLEDAEADVEADRDEDQAERERDPPSPGEKVLPRHLAERQHRHNLSPCAGSTPESCWRRVSGFPPIRSIG